MLDRIHYLGESRKKYKLINIILLATKMIIYSNQNKSFKPLLKQVNFVMKDLFHIENFWAKTNDRMAVCLGIGTQYTGELGYDGPLYDRFLHMMDDMLGPSPMHINLIYQVFFICIRRILHMTDQFSWSHRVRHIQVHLYKDI